MNPTSDSLVSLLASAAPPAGLHPGVAAAMSSEAGGDTPAPTAESFAEVFADVLGRMPAPPDSRPPMQALVTAAGDPPDPSLHLAQRMLGASEAQPTERQELAAAFALQWAALVPPPVDSSRGQSPGGDGPGVFFENFSSPETTRLWLHARGEGDVLSRTEEPTAAEALACPDAAIQASLLPAVVSTQVSPHLAIITPAPVNPPSDRALALEAARMGSSRTAVQQIFGDAAQGMPARPETAAAAPVPPHLESLRTPFPGMAPNRPVASMDGGATEAAPAMAPPLERRETAGSPRASGAARTAESMLVDIRAGLLGPKESGAAPVPAGVSPVQAPSQAPKPAPGTPTALSAARLGGVPFLSVASQGGNESSAVAGAVAAGAPSAAASVPAGRETLQRPEFFDSPEPGPGGMSAGSAPAATATTATTATTAMLRDSAPVVAPAAAPQAAPTTAVWAALQSREPGQAANMPGRQAKQPVPAVSPAAIPPLALSDGPVMAVPPGADSWAAASGTLPTGDRPVAPTDAPRPQGPPLDLRPHLDQDREALSRQLGQALASRLLGQIERGEWQVRLSVAPEHLGPIDIDLQVSGNRIEAQFQVANGQTQSLIQEGLPRLRDAVGASGMDLASVWVSGGWNERNRGNPTPGQPDDPQPGPLNQGADGQEQAVNGVETVDERPSSWTPRQGAVDILI